MNKIEALKEEIEYFKDQEKLHSDLVKWGHETAENHRVMLIYMRGRIRAERELYKIADQEGGK